MQRKLIALLAVALLLIAAGIAACGGSDDNGGGSADSLSTEDNLRVDQYRTDIEEFCNLASGPENELSNRAIVTVVESVDQMILIYKKNTNASFHEALKDRDVKMTDLLRSQAKKMRGCGRDGKVEAAKLTQALQSG